MNDQGSYVQDLVELGMTTYEARVYLALTRRDSFTPVEVATESGVPRQRIYDVLATLVARGLVRERPGASTRYAAVEPEIGVGALLAAKRQNLDVLSARAGEMIRDVADTWAAGRRQTAPLDYVDVVRDPALLAARFQELDESAQWRLITTSKAPFTQVNNISGVESTKRVVAAGGEARCIYHYDALRDEQIVREAREFIAAGEQARVSHDVPIKLTLVDDQRALFALTDPVAGGLTSTNIAIEHPAMNTMLLYAFNYLWERAGDFEDALSRIAEENSSVSTSDPS
jgi:hypothetical protein